ncbi:MAG: hypothetical protein LBG83_02655 [Oscillospiraceae bacterium]|nr:hypothetical protein [Oscillospiraceae bacterium]
MSQEPSPKIAYLQSYIRAKDFHPELKELYFMCLAEEVGELSRAMRKHLRPQTPGQLKNTIEEELWDVMYYAIAIANLYAIDLDEVIRRKEEINNAKHGNAVTYAPE